MAHAIALPNAKTNLVRLPVDVLRGKLIIMMLKLEAKTYFHPYNKIWSFIKSIYFRFGVCCVFVYESSGATISQNCSYIRNPSYPSAYTDTTALSFTVQKCDPSKNSYKLLSFICLMFCSWVMWIWVCIKIVIISFC